MNLPNLIKARDLMITVRDVNPERFDMTSFFGGNRWWDSVSQVDAPKPDPNHCGTSACLAGWIQMVNATTTEERAQDAYEYARDHLDLTYAQADELFTDSYTYNCGLMEDITPDDVINHLSSLIENAS